MTGHKKQTTSGTPIPGPSHKDREYQKIITQLGAKPGTILIKFKLNNKSAYPLRFKAKISKLEFEDDDGLILEQNFPIQNKPDLLKLIWTLNQLKAGEYSIALESLNTSQYDVYPNKPEYCLLRAGMNVINVTSVRKPIV